MTVKKLKEAIANLPDEMEVVLQKYSEDNGCRPLSGADPDAVYIPIFIQWIGLPLMLVCQTKNGNVRICAGVPACRKYTVKILTTKINNKKQ